MPSLRQLIRAADMAPMRLPLVFPNLQATYQYNVNGAAGQVGNQNVNADGEFMLGVFQRDANGVLTSARYTLNWHLFAALREPGTGAIILSILGRHNPPAVQAAVVLTIEDSAGALAQYGPGKYRLTRLNDAAPYAPDNPASSVDLNIISVQTAPGALVGPDLELGAAVVLNVGSYENIQGPVTSTDGFALRVMALASRRAAFTGTLYAARQDDETVQSFIAASGQLAYSAERLYLTRYAADVRPAQTFRAENRLWTVSEIRRVARRHMLIAADATS